MSRIVAGLLACTLLAAAPSAPPAADARTSAPPAVARISIVDGAHAVVQRADGGTQVAAGVNAPLEPGDFVTTGAHTRVEIQFDGYHVVRLASHTQARIAANDASKRTVQLAQGTLALAILHDGKSVVSVETPSITVQARRAGDYRVSVGADGATLATARAGRASIVTPAQRYRLEPGRTLSASGNASDPIVGWRSEVAYDGFDAFSAARDKAMAAAIAADRRVPSAIAGQDDLGAYGRWVSVAPYGLVWVPSVSPGWAPYRNGGWVWEDGYGWTWVSNEPWGWTPYHYGRWFYANGYGWCWYPPVVSVIPIWQPALVGFFGWGYNSVWSFSFGWSSFGWVPLAPGEAFYPWYPGYGYGYGYGYNWNPGWNSWAYNPVPTPRPSSNPRHGGGPRRPPKPPRHHGPPPRMHPLYRNLAHGGASGIGAKAFHAGDFHHVTALSATTVARASAFRGALPLQPNRDNLAFGRGLVRTPVRLARAFAQPRFARGVAWSQFAHARSAPRTLPVAGRDHVAHRRPTGATHHAPRRHGAPARPVAVPHRGATSAPHHRAPAIARSHGDATTLARRTYQQVFDTLRTAESAGGASFHAPSDQANVPNDPLHAPIEAMHAPTEAMHVPIEAMHAPTEQVHAAPPQSGHRTGHSRPPL